MSKEYTYFEAMEEILKDKDKGKRFINADMDTMFFSGETRSLNIKVSDTKSTWTMEKLVINDSWANTKWFLIEEKRNYNVRVYEDMGNERLIESVNVIKTESELEQFCNFKKRTLIAMNQGVAEKIDTYRVVAEEIITT